jgi:predicted Fe-Mo cluster-binding NifX family protein
MKIAIPVFHTKISPRFDQTQGFVLLETKNDSVVARENLTTKRWSVIEKMKQLVALRVDTLICGGIDRASLQYLSLNGVNIYSWVTGEIDDAVTCFLENRMKPGIILGKQGKMKGRWQFCKGRNHLCNMFQTGFYKSEEGGKTMPRGDGKGPKGQGPRSGKDRGGCKAGNEGRGKGQGRGQGSGQGKGGGSGQGRGDSMKGRSKGDTV